MKHKSEVERYLPMFICMVENQFGKQIKHVRTDNDMEFTSNYMQNFYENRGIVMELSCTYTPQQNGIVECKHRHILEVARALRFHSGLPIRFWGECVLTAVYIINRLPSKVINNQTPYEIMFGKRPSYDHLRVFGCLVCVLKTRKEEKFDERGKACIFFRYPLEQKGHKVYDLITTDIYVSRDVVLF